MIPLFLIFSNWAIFLLRVVFGLILVSRGWPKFKDFQKNSDRLSDLGIKPGAFWNSVIATLEVFGGLLLIAGILVQPIAILLFLKYFISLIWKIFRRQPFVNGLDLNLLMLVISLVLLTVETDIHIFNVLFWLGVL